MEQWWVRTPRTHPLDTRLLQILPICFKLGLKFCTLNHSEVGKFCHFGGSLKLEAGTPPIPATV